MAAIALATAAGPAGAAQASPVSNLDLIIDAASAAASEGLGGLDLSRLSGGPERTAAAPASLKLTSRGRHNANWVVEHVLLEGLLDRDIAVVAAPATAPTLSFRIVELGLWGYSGVLGSSVERRCRISLALQLESGGELVWTGEASKTLTDRVEKRQVEALQNTNYAFAKLDVEEQSWGNYVEPVIVSSVLGSLVYLFFSNR